MKVLLLSGGYDSSALAWMEKPDLCLTIDYGQRAAEGEVRASRAISTSIGLNHEVLRVDCANLGTGDLAGTDPLQAAPASDWWPFRNQLLLTLAAMRLVGHAETVLMIGCVRSDQHFADNRPMFIERFNSVLKYQEGQIGVVAPAIDMSTAELVRASKIPLEVLAWSHSCHVSQWACGSCRGCSKQLSVRIELGYESI